MGASFSPYFRPLCLRSTRYRQDASQTLDDSQSGSHMEPFLTGVTQIKNLIFYTVRLQELDESSRFYCTRDTERILKGKINIRGWEGRYAIRPSYLRLQQREESFNFNTQRNEYKGGNKGLHVLLNKTHIRLGSTLLPKSNQDAKNPPTPKVSWHFLLLHSQ